MNHMLLRRWRPWSAAALVLIAVAVTIVGIVGGSATAGTQTANRGSGSAWASLHKSYGVLRRAHVASALPRSVQRDLSTMAKRAPRLALDSGAVQEVSLGQAGSVWIEPGSQGLCAALTTVALDPMTGQNFTFSPWGCEPSAYALTDGVVAAMTVGAQHYVWGLVPDGNAQVTATFPSGSTRQMTVTDNAFLVQTTTAPDSLTFKDAIGATQTVPVGPGAGAGAGAGGA